MPPQFQLFSILFVGLLSLHTQRVLGETDPVARADADDPSEWFRVAISVLVLAPFPVAAATHGYTTWQPLLSLWRDHNAADPAFPVSFWDFVSNDQQRRGPLARTPESALLGPMPSHMANMLDRLRERVANEQRAAAQAVLLASLLDKTVHLAALLSAPGAYWGTCHHPDFAEGMSAVLGAFLDELGDVVSQLQLTSSESVELHLAKLLKATEAIEAMAPEVRCAGACGALERLLCEGGGRPAALLLRPARLRRSMRWRRDAAPLLDRAAPPGRPPLGCPVATHSRPAVNPAGARQARQGHGAQRTADLHG